MKSIYIALIGIVLSVNCLSQNLLNNPESVVYDSLYNRYLVSNWGSGEIIQIDSNRVQNPFNTYFDHIAGLHIAGNILYAAANLSANAGLIGIDLATADTVMNVKIPGMQLLNDITSDTSGNLYVTEYYGNKIYKVRISDQAYSTFVDSGLNLPNGILFDKRNNRLLVMSEGGVNAPIIAVNIEDSTIYTVVYTNLYLTDGLSEDAYGNIYVSSWSSNSVYRYDSTFSNPPEVISVGHSGPADIFFNKLDNILAVPNFHSNSVDFIPISSSEVEIESDQILGYKLYQNYPNPFNPGTTISYQIPELSYATLKVYDVLGNEILTLVNEEKPAGKYQIEFDAAEFASGFYFYQLIVGKFTATMKMLLLK